MNGVLARNARKTSIYFHLDSLVTMAAGNETFHDKIQQELLRKSNIIINCDLLLNNHISRTDCWRGWRQ